MGSVVRLSEENFSGVVYNQISNSNPKTSRLRAVRSVVVSLALHARGRGFNPHTVQIVKNDLYLDFCHIFVSLILYSSAPLLAHGLIVS